MSNMSTKFLHKKFTIKIDGIVRNDVVGILSIPPVPGINPSCLIPDKGEWKVVMKNGVVQYFDFYQVEIIFNDLNK